MTRITDYIAARTSEYIDLMPKVERKRYGQFFTDRETAVFMASLFDIPANQQRLSVLDPGAGSGILSAALVERLQEFPNIHEIALDCYETDPKVFPLLKENLRWICEHTPLSFSWRVIPENYILSQASHYTSEGTDCNPHLQKYDLVIGNPPYRKLPKDAPEAKAMPDICYGAPNLYSLFVSMSLFHLRNQGELVYIIPRSWTSGAYFKRFRKKILREGALTHIHLFISRDKVFEKEGVLQETMIIKLRKTRFPPNAVAVTTTADSRDFSKRTIFRAPYQTIVSGEERYVYLATNREEASALARLNVLGHTLPDLGLRMRTGLTVDFRSGDALRSRAEDHAVPLFYARHIQNGRIVFPVGKGNEYLVTSRPSLLQPNTNYLFLKRFTSKEEPRRLQCGIYLAKLYPNYEKISTQNKINFITGHNGLSECVTYGLYVLFNSTLYDQYYRILNGSTQVNSSEINTLPVPSLDAIERMGKALMAARDVSVSTCDQILGGYV